MQLSQEGLSDKSVKQLATQKLQCDCNWKPDVLWLLN